MKPLSLSLRQHKILQILQNETTYITGSALAQQLNVSSRTIRNDITEINQSLAPVHARILSEKSKGYLFYAENPQLIQNIQQDDSVFLTREDRVRYLALQLCLSDIPIHLYDLEEEMAVSHTTLNHDLHQLKIRFVYSAPHISLSYVKKTIAFEQNEEKRREILNLLFREDWDYDARGNAYYSFHFLDPEILEKIMIEVPLHLQRYDIQMEDSSRVSLNLAIAIMYHRVKSGHPLPSAPLIPKDDTQAMYACQDLMDALEKCLHCSFRPEERDAIYLNISSGHLLDASKLTAHNAPQFFGPITIEMAGHYLKEIDQVFHLDFRNDEDFFITLLQFIRSLQTPVQTWNTQGNLDIVKSNLFVEYEFAYLFQKTAIKYLGYYINQDELLYLAYCISGALEYYHHHHPEYKLKTVICCQLNLAGIWALKRKVLGAFYNYINITALLPVNARSAYDFHDTDLILTTVRREITNAPHSDVLRISTFMNPTDHRNLEAYIQKKRIQRLCPYPDFSLTDLLKNAWWHENQSFRTRFSVIEFMSSDFINNGITDSEFLLDILRRESLSSYACCPGILFLHSLANAKETHLSVTTLNHRILWNSHKIRIIIMASFHPDDIPLLFRLISCFYQDYYQPESLKKLKTKKDVLSYFESSDTTDFI